MLYYFPHPSSLRNEINVIRMRQRWGSAGYGLYLMLLELLRESEGQQLFYFPEAIAYALHESNIDMLESVVNDFSLFTRTSDDFIQSSFLALCQQQADERAAKAREWGRMGAKARYSRADGAQSTPNPAAANLSEPQQTGPQHGNIPYTLPMGGGMDSPCLNQPIQDKQPNEEEKKQPTKSKLADMEWLGLSGMDWLSFCRHPDLMGETEALRLLDLPRIADRNPTLLVDWIRRFGLPKRLWGTLQTKTEDWRIESPVFQALFAVVRHVRDTKYKPVHPSEYLITTAIKFYRHE